MRSRGPYSLDQLGLSIAGYPVLGHNAMPLEPDTACSAKPVVPPEIF